MFMNIRNGHFFADQRFLMLVLFVAWCFDFTFQKADAQFAKGADIGWLDQMEATGYKFYDSNGMQKDCLQILKEKGINTIRLRVWVNPSDDKIDGHCSKKEVATMALRAKNRGMRIMIDFQYSDTWADPAHQTKPAAWRNHTFSQLLDDVYSHTYEVLDTLKQIGVTPEWVQIGNEIPGGMLLPEGSADNWPQLAQLINKGYHAVKAINKKIKVILQLDRGNENKLFRYFFDNAVKYKAHYDVIGMSYYPYVLQLDYTKTIDALGDNLNDMAKRYGKEVMIVETGDDYKLEQNTYNMLVSIQKKVKAVPHHKGIGVVYWEPEGEMSWSGYLYNCWRKDGRPSKAMDAFLVNP
jgi:arabinogalactan endo-1,4-beta-galactosidase